MLYFVNALIAFLFVLTPFSQGCTKLMDGKDKDENKKELIAMLRKVADMLEEQEDILPSVDNVDPTLQIDEWGRPKYVERPGDWPLAPNKYPVPHAVPSIQSTPAPSSLKGGSDWDDFTPGPNDQVLSNCPLSDVGSPDGCGAKMAKGEVNNFQDRVQSPSPKKGPWTAGVSKIVKPRPQILSPKNP